MHMLGWGMFWMCQLELHELCWALGLRLHVLCWSLGLRIFWWSLGLRRHRLPGFFFKCLSSCFSVFGVDEIFLHCFFSPSLSESPLILLLFKLVDVSISSGCFC